MALTPEQQAEVDKQAAITAAQISAGQPEAARHRKLEAVRIAHTTLLENKRNLPIEQRQITAAEIMAFADSLNAYINA